MNDRFDDLIPGKKPDDLEPVDQIPDRDDELGAAIDALGVPERPDGFIDDLMERIAIEEAGLGREVASVREAEPPFAAAASLAAAAPIASDTPATETARRRRLDGRRVRRLLIAAVAAAALITLGTLFGVSRDTDTKLRFDPEPATAREVIESTLAATGAAGSIQGLMTVGFVEDDGSQEFQKLTFIVDADGNMASRQIGPDTRTGVAGLDTVYLTAERRWRMLATYDQPFTSDSTETGPDGTTTTTTEQSRFVLQEATRLAAGSPCRGDLVDGMLPWVRLRAYLRQLLDGESPDMRELTVDGRLAWELTTVQNGGNLYDDSPAAQPVTIVIDQLTRLPLRYTWKQSRNLRVEVRFADYRLDAEVDDDAFTLDVPADAIVMDRTGDVGPDGGSDDRRYSEIDFDDAKLMSEKIGAVPGLPAWHPQGFGLADATWAPDPSTDPPDPGTATVSLAYRRGLDVFYVSVEPTYRGVEGVSSWTEGEPRYSWRVDTSDPFGRAWGTSLEYRRRHMVHVKLHGGAFDGRAANLVLDPSVLPHLYVSNGRYTATVSGDLSQDEMIQVAESLGAPWMDE